MGGFWTRKTGRNYSDIYCLPARLLATRVMRNNVSHCNGLSLMFVLKLGISGGGLGGGKEEGGGEERKGV